VSSPSLTPDEIRAAAETHHEIGPDYQSAVIESFLDKVGREIDARVDARLAGRQGTQPGQFGQPAPFGHPGQAGQPGPFAPPQQYAQPPPRAARERSAFALAVVSMAFGIPLTAIVVTAGPHPSGMGGLVVIWLAIAVINVAYSLHIRPPGDRR
jgi:hypothetical protein